MDLEDIMCGGRVTEGQMLFNSTLHEVSRLVIFIKLESTMVVARGWWERGIMFNRYRVSFWQDVLKVMVWWLHWIVHFTMVKMVDLGCPWGSSGAPREEGMGSSLAQKLKIPHSSWCSQTEKERKSSAHRPLLSDRTTWSQFIYFKGYVMFWENQSTKFQVKCFPFTSAVANTVCYHSFSLGRWGVGEWGGDDLKYQQVSTG